MEHIPELIKMDLQELEKVNYCRTEEELQFFVLFAVAVAGKKAKNIIKALNDFVEIGRKETNETLPFEIIKKINLKEAIVKSRLGQHNKLYKAYNQIAYSGIDLKTCLVEDLEKIHGIGKKSSRFFMIYNRKDVKYAVLDRHILSYLREQGFAVPKNTPVGKKYDEIEKMFIKHARNLKVSVADLDLMIWKKKSKNEFHE